MSLSVTYANINSLGEVSLIAGSTYTLKFIVNDQSGSPVNLSSATCKWAMAQYGQDYSVLTKTGNVISTNTFSIYLSALDTYGMSGKFSHQPSIIFPSGLVLIPAQGIITLVKEIK